jgi:hypothetical protein
MRQAAKTKRNGGDLLSKDQNKTERKKTIHRVEKNKDFSVLCNIGPSDERLTYGARGLLTFMLTRPDDWVFYDEELAKHTPETLYKVKQYMKELKTLGYVKRQPIKDPETHQIERWETVLYEVPQIPDQPDPEDEKEDAEEDPGNNQEPEVEIQSPGEKPMDPPEVEKPDCGFPHDWNPRGVGNQQLLNTNNKPNTDKTNIPIRDQQVDPGHQNLTIPDIQKPTAIIFLEIGKKKALSPDDVICLNLLFKIHTPAAIQKQILESFERLNKKKSVKVEFEGQEYTITDPAKLPIRYVYNSMKNWSSLRNTKGGGQGGQTRGNPDRSAKDYQGKAASGFFVQ